MIAGFIYRGFSPHKFTPMPGVHQRIQQTQPAPNCVWGSFAPDSRRLAFKIKGCIIMYTEHSKLFLRYDDSQRIWRYMTYERFKSLIQNEALFFCRADKFDDKWEGVFPIKMIENF
jgi:hypothetical protein